MYMWERKTISERFWNFLGAMSGVLFCLILFLLATGLKESAEKKAFADFQVFLKQVNEGQYDGRLTKVPFGFELNSVEVCLDGNRYVSGTQSPYKFSGYTSPNKLTENMRWEFYGYREFPPYAILELVGLAGILPCLLWAIVSRFFWHTNLKKFLMDW